MPHVERGPLPWDPSFFDRYKAANKLQKKKAGLGNQILVRDGKTLSSGWVGPTRDPNAWHEVTLPNGRKNYVPKNEALEYFSFSAIEDDKKPEDMGEYIAKAFDHTEGRGRYYECDGCGHISKLRYNPTYQTLEVTFANNGAVIVCFRVPPILYAELSKDAESKAVAMGFDLKARHLLGIRFWDLMRVRGVVTGMRYQFTYIDEGHWDASQDIPITGPGYGTEYTIAKNTKEGQADYEVNANREAIITNKEENKPSAKQEADNEKIRDRYDGLVYKKFAKSGPIMREWAFLSDDVTDAGIQKMEAWLTKKGLI